MAKTLKIETEEGRKYILEYTRQTVKMMEQSGFEITKVSDRPMSILDLFAGAFLAHHRKTSRKEIEDIYDHLQDRSKLIEALSDMYSAPILALTNEEDTEGNATWSVE